MNIHGIRSFTLIAIGGVSLAALLVYGTGCLFGAW